MNVCVGRHVNGISINPLEFILNNDNTVMEFQSEDIAKTYLKDNGFSDEDIYWFHFKPA